MKQFQPTFAQSELGKLGSLSAGMRITTGKGSVHPEGSMENIKDGMVNAVLIAQIRKQAEKMRVENKTAQMAVMAATGITREQIDEAIEQQ